MSEAAVRALSAVADSEAAREERARSAAEMVREARDYGWVGVYDVGDEEFSLVGSSGSQPPAQPRLELTEGLGGEAVRSRVTVVSATRSEAIVPILGPESGIVIGVLDAASDRPGALSEEDVGFLEACAAVLRPLYD